MMDMSLHIISRHLHIHTATYKVAYGIILIIKIPLVRRRARRMADYFGEQEAEWKKQFGK